MELGRRIEPAHGRRGERVDLGEADKEVEEGAGERQEQRISFPMEPCSHMLFVETDLVGILWRSGSSGSLESERNGARAGSTQRLLEADHSTEGIFLTFNFVLAHLFPLGHMGIITSHFLFICLGKMYRWIEPPISIF